MFKSPVIKFVIMLGLSVSAAHLLAVHFHLYWTIREFDSLSHFLAGAFVSSVFIWLFFFSGFFNLRKINLLQFLVTSILGVVLVSVGWEIFELITDTTSTTKINYYFDTTLDTIMAILGGIIFSLFFYRKHIVTKGNAIT